MQKLYIAVAALMVACGSVLAQGPDAPWLPFSTDYGTASISGNSSTKTTTLTITNIVAGTVAATTVTANNTNLTALTDFAVGRALSAGSASVSTNLSVGATATALDSYAGSVTGGELSITTNANIGGTLTAVGGLWKTNTTIGLTGITNVVIIRGGIVFSVTP